MSTKASIALVTALCLAAGCTPQGPSPEAAPCPATAPGGVGEPPAPPRRIESTTLANLYRLDSRTYCGGGPEGDEAFAELRRLGVTRIVSVDGAPPDLERARRHGMSYGHLPVGYDRITPARAAEIAQAASGGVVYLHCHHGKHRGPAAAGLALRINEGWDAQRAERWLKQAGTSPQYAGLFESVRTIDARAARLHPPAGPAPESVPPPDLVRVMLEIDRRHEALQRRLAAAAREASGASDPSDAHGASAAADEATLLMELYRELARSPATQARDEDFHRRLALSQARAAGLAEALRAGERGAEVAARGKAVAADCRSCHARYRDGGGPGRG